MPCTITVGGDEACHSSGDLHLPFDCPIDTIVHEIGHLVDWALCDDPRIRGNDGDGDLDSGFLTDTECELILPWREALHASATYLRLLEAHDRIPSGRWIYLTAETELFARAYTQHVLMRTPQWRWLIDSYSIEIEESHGVADLAHWPGSDFDAIDDALTSLLADPSIAREARVQGQAAA